MSNTTNPSGQDTVVTQPATGCTSVRDDGLVSLRTAVIMTAAAGDVWLNCTHPAVGGAVTGGIVLTYLLHRLLHRS